MASQEPATASENEVLWGRTRGQEREAAGHAEGLGARAPLTAPAAEAAGHAGGLSALRASHALQR